jgi:hypothetical protein
MPRKKSKPDPTRAGSLVWTKRGDKHRALAVIVRPGAAGFLMARAFNETAKTWAKAALIGAAQVITFADPTDYAVRHALTFADVELTNLLLRAKP